MGLWRRWHRMCDWQGKVRRLYIAGTRLLGRKVKLRSRCLPMQRRSQVLAPSPRFNGQWSSQGTLHGKRRQCLTLKGKRGKGVDLIHLGAQWLSAWLFPCSRCDTAVAFAVEVAAADAVAAATKMFFQDCLCSSPLRDLTLIERPRVIAERRIGRMGLYLRSKGGTVAVERHTRGR